MKTLITISALAPVSNLAVAENFSYEQQIASPELNANIQSLDFNSSKPLPSTRDVRVSLDNSYRGNPDVAQVPYNHEDMVIRAAMSFTAYDELSRQNPDLGGV